MSPITTRDCPRCGAPVELGHLKSGQRLLLDPGLLPVYTGSDSTGGVTFGRTLHQQTCPGERPLTVDDPNLRRLYADGPWKPQEELDRVALADQGDGPRKKGARR